MIHFESIEYRPLTFLLVSAVLMMGSPLLAQPDEAFRVNSYTTSEQRFAAVSVFPDGRFVVVWESRLFPGGGSAASVVGRRFDASAMPKGEDFLIAAMSTHDTVFPSVAAQPDGGFVVAWESDLETILARRFDAADQPVGGEFQINTTTPNARVGAISLSSDDQGDFVAGWVQQDPGVNGNDIKIRRFDSAGAPISGDVQVFRAPSLDFDIKSAADGQFTVVWNDSSAPRFRRYAADATPLDFPEDVPFSAGPLRSVAAAQGPGDILFLSQTVSDDLVGSRFDSSGAPVGDVLQIAPAAGDRSLVAASHGGPSGDAVLQQTQFSPDDDSSTGVEMLRLSSDGSLIGRMQVNTFTSLLQRPSEVLALADGVFLVVWESLLSDNGDPNLSVQGRIIRDDLFTDGFESGDISMWDISVP